MPLKCAVKKLYERRKRRCVFGGNGREDSLIGQKSLSLQGFRLNKEHLSWQRLTRAAIKTRLCVTKASMWGIMFIALLFIMYVRVNVFIWPLLGSGARSSIPWKITGGSPCEHLGSGCQRERNNNPLWCLPHALRDANSFFSDYFVLHQLCWRLGKKWERRERKRQGRRKVSGREEKVRADLKFQLSPGSYTNSGWRWEEGDAAAEAEGWMDGWMRREGRREGVRRSAEPLSLDSRCAGSSSVAVLAPTRLLWEYPRHMSPRRL